MTGTHDYLISTSIIDCQGRATHTLTLQLDGTVEVRSAMGDRLLIDPARRCCLTPGARVPEQLMDLAASLRP
jgi:hypothetical protein